MTTKQPCAIVRVHDGDSMTVQLLGAAKPVTIRLDQIDAPELKQDYGKKARAALDKLARSRPLFLVRSKRDKYGRIIGTILFDDGTSLNQLLVQQGHAWAYIRYVRDARITQAEVEARTAKRGLWSFKRKPTPPWQYRQRHSIGEVRNGNYQEEGSEEAGQEAGGADRA